MSRKIKYIALASIATVVIGYAGVRSTYESPKGLGDEVAIFTNIFGVDSLVKDVVGEDCGCNERQDQFNQFIPYD
jgi:hypothetical protein|tara:strand:- start:551 stop:775 length:225 start_codon:yes stop_codon:yes gene_type:complete